MKSIFCCIHLLHVSSKIRSFRRAEKSCKRLWLLNKAKNKFKCNPYKAGKCLLDPKCFVSLKVNQANLDQLKAPYLNDKSYAVPLWAFHHNFKSLKCLKKVASLTMISCLLSSHRNASAPGLNGIPYKVYKTCSKLMQR